MTLVEAIERIAGRRSLTEQEARSVMASVMDGEATPAQISALLVALRMKGETTSELVGFAREMRARVTQVENDIANLVDTCGTGGDSVKTFNLSTAAAIVAAGAGAPIAKHGNRAVTSKCGSADVLEGLGINLNLSPSASGELLRKIGLTFMFAPNFHPAMKHAGPVRREIKLRTVFNLLGPLTNPAGASRQLIGVYAPNKTLQVAQVLNRLGCKRAVIAHGLIGLDEVSPIGSTLIAVLKERNVKSLTIHPEDFDVIAPNLSQITAGETVEENIAKISRALNDAKSPEATAVVPGAAVALWLADMATDFKEGASRAREAIKSGKAAAKLEELKEWSNRLA